MKLISIHCKECVKEDVCFLKKDFQEIKEKILKIPKVGDLGSFASIILGCDRFLPLEEKISGFILPGEEDDGWIDKDIRP